LDLEVGCWHNASDVAVDCAEVAHQGIAAADPRVTPVVILPPVHFIGVIAAQIILEINLRAVSLEVAAVHPPALVTPLRHVVKHF